MGAFSRLLRRDDDVSSLPVMREARYREHGVVATHKRLLPNRQTAVPHAE